MDKQRYTACFTGHRTIRGQDRERLAVELPTLLERLYRERGIRYYGCGGAMGFDLLAANAVLEIRKCFPEVNLIMVLPFCDQTAKWTDEAEIEHYHRVLLLANAVKYTGTEYSPNCYAVRNQHMIDCSSLLIAYQYKSGSGAYQTVNMARRKGIKILNLA